MKPATQAVRDVLMKNVDVRAVPKLRAEWEHNRYSPIASITVTPENPASELEWNGVFDLTTITLPNRPRTGIAKARLTEPLKLQSGYRDTPQAARFYAASDTDPYKYFSSWTRSKTTPVATADYEFVAPIVITLTYTAPVFSNKVVIGFETSYARPKSYDIEIQEGSTWKRIGQNIIPNADGQVVLYRNSAGTAWDTPAVYDSATSIKAIRLTVRSMNEGNANLDVIQMGARLENDLTDFVISYDKQFELSQRSFIAPLGKASSNEASVVLTNMDLRFNNDNVNSIYYGLIDKKVKLTLDLSIDARSTGGQADERIREFTMYADSWGGQDEDSVTVALKDSSVFLQEAPMPKVLWENMTVGAIIWQIMDTVGMANYLYTRDVLDTGQVIPYFWADDGTAWEQIASLAEGTQTAVFFDEWDVMQIRTRKSMFGNGNKTIQWNLDAVRNGTKLPDIVEMSTDDSLAVNQVNVNWKPAEYSDFNNGNPKMETVWEPEEDTVLLRACALTADLLTNSTVMRIKQADAAYWPYESMVNVRGEVLSYKGKEYMWNKIGGTKVYEYCYSQEDKDRIDKQSDPNLVWANSFTGALKINQRGIAGSGVADHKMKNSTFTMVNTNVQNLAYYMVTPSQPVNGVLTLTAPANHRPIDLVLYKHQDQIVSPRQSTFGTRLRFPSPNLSQGLMAGIWIDGDVGDAGYYIRVSPTEIMELEARQFRHEISIERMPINAASIAVPGGQTGTHMGSTATILMDQWYDLEVTYRIETSGDAVLTVFLDGVNMGDWRVPKSQRPINSGPMTEWGHTGVFVQSLTRAEFEYLYGIDQYNPAARVGDPTWYDPPDATGYLDLVRGGFVSGYIERAWRWGEYQFWNRGPEAWRWVGPTLTSRASYFYEEFGPIAHEMREYNVTFDEDDVPVGHSSLYISNSQVVCVDYNADAFGAQFLLVNASRRDAIVKGEDKITAGEDNSIDQKMFVYGRKLYQDEENQLVKKDDQSIRRKGVISLDFDNRHIQTKVAADDLGQWVLDLWGMGADEVSLEIFGNPLIQIGDLVTVNYPAKDMTPATHKYYVVDVDGNFNEGYETKLILRRASL